MEFGSYVRDVRERRLNDDRSYSLRQVAGRVGLEPAYLSKIERDVTAPPSEETIGRLAEDLGEDRDLLLAMAGKVSNDLRQIIIRRAPLFRRPAPAAQGGPGSCSPANCTRGFEMAIGSESERASVPRRGGKPHHD